MHHSVWSSVTKDDDCFLTKIGHEVSLSPSNFTNVFSFVSTRSGLFCVGVHVLGICLCCQQPEWYTNNAW